MKGRKGIPAQRKGKRKGKGERSMSCDKLLRDQSKVDAKTTSVLDTGDRFSDAAEYMTQYDQ